MKRKTIRDKTVGISIALALLYIAILVIIIVTGCKDSFTDFKPRVGFFKDIPAWKNEMKRIRKLSS